MSKKLKDIIWEGEDWDRPDKSLMFGYVDTGTTQGRFTVAGLHILYDKCVLTDLHFNGETVLHPIPMSIVIAKEWVRVQYENWVGQLLEGLYE